MNKRMFASTVVLATVLCCGNTSAQNTMNPVLSLKVNELQYNITEKKNTVGSVLGTIAEAAAGQSSNGDHKEKLPAINAAVKSAMSAVRRFRPLEDVDDVNLELSGEVTQINTTTKSRTVEEKDSKGKVHKRVVTDYDGTVGVSLSLKDMATGEVRTATFTGSSGWADGAKNESETLSMCIGSLKRKIIRYYNAMFPLAANIVERGNEKKDKTKEVYIDLGNDFGLYKGQKFEVFVVGEVAGREVRSKIGKLKVSEVVADDISLCKVTSGGKDIKTAFDSGKKLMVLTDD